MKLLQPTYRWPHSLYVLALAGLALISAGGCDSTDESPAGTVDDDEIDTARSSGGGAGSGAGAPLLEPPKKGRGAQFTMTTHLGANEEREYCKFVRTEEELIINHDEISFTQGSHHVLMFATTYKEFPEKNERGEAVDTHDVFDCSDGVQGVWSVQGMIAASQSANGDSAISFPKGVGLRVPAGTILMFNAHYINVSDKDLDPEIYVNLHTIPEKELKQEGGLLFWYNPFLKVPAAGESTMRSSCPITEDIRITNLQSHMHRRGVGYETHVLEAGGERAMVYENPEWQDVPVQAFAPELSVSAGSRVEWLCKYRNPADRDVYQGPRSTDEMCVLIGSYYPRNDTIGYCGRPTAAFLGARWSIGAGTASCAESLSCVIAASAENGAAGGKTVGSSSQALTTRITECLLASKPALAAPVSDMLGCLASIPADGNPLADCAAEVAACSAQ